MKINRVTMLGHKDHGKSTLIGNLLLSTDSISKERIDEAKEISKKLGKPFEPGFLLDSFYEERREGLTIDTTRTQIKYKNKAFEFIDVPGHEELIGNMMSGASYAKTAILMVSAKQDEGIREQSRRHIFLARMFGISNIIVAVNKMDAINYNEHIFNNIKNSLLNFIQKIGYKHIAFVPISAYGNENLIKSSDNMKWYNNGPLMDILLKFIQDDSNASGKYGSALILGYIDNDKKNILSSRIVSGTVKNGRYMIVPKNKYCKINKIIARGKKVKNSFYGDNPLIYINNEISDNVRGMVITNEKDKVKAQRNFNSLIFVVNEFKGNLFLRFNGIDIKCKNLRIKEVIDLEGVGTKRSDIMPLEFGSAHIVLEKPIAASKFDDIEELGRFTIYSNNKFVGIGILN